MTRARFSARSAWDLSENRLSRVIAEARAQGRPLVDLTEGNPTRAGFTRGTALVSALGDERGAHYEPLPHGHPQARAAVARYYEERGFAVDPASITLSASTSEAYGWLFKLLCERGDRVLVPVPSYPLFAFLATLEDVALTPYPLMREEGFRIDLASLERSIDDRTRAILLVHPNNPTGSFIRRSDARALGEIARDRGLSLIVDEVFGDYANDPLPSDRLPSFVGSREALTFVLSGLSKVMALPQLKLGWIVTQGPADLVIEATRRLEVIADTYLSVSTPVQLALPEILARRGDVQREVRDRVSENLATLDAVVAALGPSAVVRRLSADGGWYAILEVPRTREEDEWIELLVRDDAVIVHPGYFFDMPREGFLVVSLLPRCDVFAAAIRRVVARVSIT